MANLTKEQRHNKRLHEIFQPEIDRIKKVEIIADEILNKIESLGKIDTGLSRCHFINGIQKILSEKMNLK